MLYFTLLLRTETPLLDNILKQLMTRHQLIPHIVSQHVVAVQNITSFSDKCQPKEHFLYCVFWQLSTPDRHVEVCGNVAIHPKSPPGGLWKRLVEKVHTKTDTSQICMIQPPSFATAGFFFSRFHYNSQKGRQPKFTFSHFTRDPNLHMNKFTWDPNLHITEFTRDPNLHDIKFTRNPNLHKKFTQHQICTDPNLHKHQIYTGPKLTQTQFHTKATFTHERAY